MIQYSMRYQGHIHCEWMWMFNSMGVTAHLFNYFAFAKVPIGITASLLLNAMSVIYIPST